LTRFCADKDESIVSFFTPAGQYSVTKSRYSSASSTSVRQIGQARLLGGVDASEQEDLTRRREYKDCLK